MTRYTLTDQRHPTYPKLRRVRWANGREGGWLESEDSLPQNGTAVLHGNVRVFARARLFGGDFLGGDFRGGDFLGGDFRGGGFHGGGFHGGYFFGGDFHGGYFHGGGFHGGDFHGGYFHGGGFHGGEFRGGEFRGGDFRGGYFLGGDFRGGDFLGGEFRGGDFLGGDFRGGVFHRTPPQIARSDGYIFTAKHVDGGLRIWAGCRDFSWAEAKAHWGDPKHHAHEESTRILKLLKWQAKRDQEFTEQKEAAK